MKNLSDKKIEFIAKTATDLGKALVVLGFASAFFEKFPFVLRMSIGCFSLVLLFAGIIVFPSGGED